MGRPRKAAPPAEAPAFRELALRKSGDAAIEYAEIVAAEDGKREKAARALAARLCYAGPIDRQALEDEANNQYERAARAFVNFGCALLLLKTRVGHGEFLKALQERRWQPRTAQRAMLAMNSFSVSPEAIAFAKSLDSQTKVLTLAEELSPEDLDRLAAGEEVRGVCRGDLETLTAKEVKERFRKEVEEKEQAKLRIVHLEAELVQARRNPVTDAQAEAAATAALREARRQAMDQARAQIFVALATLGRAAGDYVRDEATGLDPQRDAARFFDDVLEELQQAAEANGIDWAPVIHGAQHHKKNEAKS